MINISVKLNLTVKLYLSINESVDAVATLLKVDGRKVNSVGETAVRVRICRLHTVDVRANRC